MNIERTIEFIIKNQARMDARFDAKFDRADERFAKAEKRFAEAEKRFAEVEKRLDRLERVVTQNNHVVAQLARVDVGLRSDVRRTERNLKEVSEKLNILIDVVDRHVRGNGHH